jgi:PPP family 3-phenylpropionic acid transporter
MANARSLIVFYVLFFMFVGITLPFLPVYYHSLSIEPTRIGLLLSVGPLFSLLVPPFWGQLADRTGRPGRVLAVIALGSLAGFSGLLLASTFATVLACLIVFSSFCSATTTIIDSLALAHVEQHGGSFAKIRTFGSLGFVLSTLVFGFSVEKVDRRVVFASVAVIATYTIWAMATLARAPQKTHHGPKADVRAGLALLRDTDLRWLLTATAAHWVASAPYHGSLSIHFKALSFAPSIVSLSASVAVASEVIVFATWQRWAPSFRPRTLLLTAFAVSAGRWMLMGLTSEPTLLVAVAASHGISFGVFYIASISWTAERVPISLRSTGQSLFVSATFGIGGLIGFASSGRLYDLVGGHRLFQVAAFAEMIPLIIVAWRLGQPKAPPAL